jgi:hypothetical protein
LLLLENYRVKVKAPFLFATGKLPPRCSFSHWSYEYRPPRAAAYRTPTGTRLQFTHGDSRVQDHQDVAGPVTNLGQIAELSRALWGRPALQSVNRS